MSKMRQQHGAKVWKTFMSIERGRNKEKRSVRTLIVISRLKQDGQDCQDSQDEVAIAGDRPPHYEKNAPRTP